MLFSKGLSCLTQWCNWLVYCASFTGHAATPFGPPHWAEARLPLKGYPRLTSSLGPSLRTRQLLCPFLQSPISHLFKEDE